MMNYFNGVIKVTQIERKESSKHFTVSFESEKFTQANTSKRQNCERDVARSEAEIDS